MKNGYIKFNAWTKIPPLTSENMKIFVNAGDHRLKQKYNSLCLNASAMNKFGKMPEIAKESQGMSRAISAFFKQIEPDLEVPLSDLKKHNEPFVETRIGTFCITDIAEVCGVNVFSDGLWLVSRGDVAGLWHCDDFFKIHL